jgi:hypothetical protein
MRDSVLQVAPAIRDGIKQSEKAVRLDKAPESHLRVASADLSGTGGFALPSSKQLVFIRDFRGSIRFLRLGVLCARPLFGESTECGRAQTASTVAASIMSCGGCLSSQLPASGLFSLPHWPGFPTGSAATSEWPCLTTLAPCWSARPMLG